MHGCTVRTEGPPVNTVSRPVTDRKFTKPLRDEGILVSMDGKGRYQDNILITGRLDILVGSGEIA
ncbi:MAG: hypothetical protein J7M25_02695 [Deltaproteobacteria bacterium]|nr:hypothetical protein [Deltaproteobacteria bacterium]